MTNNNTIKHTLEKSGLDYKTYISLNSSYRIYLSNCAKYGVTNPAPSFATDDVVIRKINKSLDTDAYGVAIKWKILICAYGLVLGRRILTKRLGRIEVINDINSTYHNVSVEIDPDLIENILLSSDEFDPNTDRNKSIKLRRRASKYNKSISQKITTIHEAENYFESLAEGDVIYCSPSLIGLTTHPRLFTVVKIVRTMKCIDYIIIRLKSSAEVSLKPRSILRCFIATQEPYPLSKILSK
jgi:hypothetical protein